MNRRTASALLPPLANNRSTTRLRRLSIWCLAILALAALAVMLVWSLEDGADRADAQTALPEVTGLTLTWSQLSSTSVRVEWPPFPAATSYDVQWKPHGAADSAYRLTTSGVSPPSVDVPKGRATIAGMTANTVYTVRVFATATGPLRDVAKSVFPVIATSGNQTDVPGLTATTTTAAATSIKLDWNAVTGATGYFVSWTSSGQGIRSVDLASTARTHTIEGLTTGTEYTVRVFAIPSSGAVTHLSEVKATPGEAAVITSSEPGFTVTPSAVTLAEAGGTATFSVKLSTQPSSAVSVFLSSSDRTVVTINDTVPQTYIKQLDFTSSNWNTAQRVTVTG